MTIYIFKHLSYWVIVWAAVTFAAEWIIYRKIKNIWKRIVQENNFKPISYKGETFRSPLNMGMTILSVLIPVTSGLFAYVITKSYDTKVDFLVVAIFCMLFSMVWGGYQSYSLATQCKDDDKFEITKDRNWLIPADFVAQLALLFFGIFWFTAFLIISFKPEVGNSTKSLMLCDSINILHAKPILGMSDQELIGILGKPRKITKQSTTITKYYYVSPSSEYILYLEKGQLSKIVERKKIK